MHKVLDTHLTTLGCCRSSSREISRRDDVCTPCGHKGQGSGSSGCNGEAAARPSVLCNLWRPVEPSSPLQASKVMSTQGFEGTETANKILF